MTPPRIFFIRIPKTASSSLERHFKLGFGDEQVFSLVVPTAEAVAVTVRRDAPSARVISGHYPYGAHALLGGERRFHYITLSRDPVERICSLYHYCNDVRCAGHRYHRPDLSLDDWLDFCGPSDTSNTAVRYLAGLRIEAGARTPLQPVTKAHFELAREHLRRHFVVVGVVERFDAMLDVLSAYYGWDKVPSLAINGRRGAPVVAQREQSDRQRLPAPLVARIDAINAFDLELHHWIKEQLAP